MEHLLKNFIRLRFEDIQTGFVVYKTYMSTNKDDSTIKVYEEIETKGSNQQNPIGFMFGERPTYKAVRDAIKIKNATTGQDAYADSIGIGMQDDSFLMIYNLMKCLLHKEFKQQHYKMKML